jgi:hypothetical protein
MLAPLNKQPTGLLRLLGLSGPDSPNVLSDTVQGELDLMPWYLAALDASVVATNVPAAGIGGMVTVATVPATQRWILTGFHCRAQVNNVGHELQLSCATLTTVANAILLHGEPSPRVLWTAGNEFVGANGIDKRQDYVLLGPGDQLGPFYHVVRGAAQGTTFTTYRYAAFSL